MKISESLSESLSIPCAKNRTLSLRSPSFLLSVGLVFFYVTLSSCGKSDVYHIIAWNVFTKDSAKEIGSSKDLSNAQFIARQYAQSNPGVQIEIRKNCKDALKVESCEAILKGNVFK